MIQTKVYRVLEKKYTKREGWKQMKQIFPNEQKKQNNLKQTLIRDFERKQSNDSYVLLVCMYNKWTRFIVSGILTKYKTKWVINIQRVKSSKKTLSIV